MEQQISIDLKKAQSVKCDKCGNEVFTIGYVIKRVSGIELGTGAEDRYVEVPVYVCNKCGAVEEKQRKELGLDSKPTIEL